MADTHAAFLADVRAELSAAEGIRRAVPRSGRAALLSGLVVGCALAGFNVTGDDGAARLAGVAGKIGMTLDATCLVPGLLVLGLLGGARTSALTMIAVHAVLRRMGQTSHQAYALGGAAAALLLASALATLFGHAPAHGWAVEAAAGAGAGLFYRVFAGSRAG